MVRNVEIFDLWNRSTRRCVLIYISCHPIEVNFVGLFHPQNVFHNLIYDISNTTEGIYGWREAKGEKCAMSGILTRTGLRRGKLTTPKCRLRSWLKRKFYLFGIFKLPVEVSQTTQLQHDRQWCQRSVSLGPGVAGTSIKPPAAFPVVNAILNLFFSPSI